MARWLAPVAGIIVGIILFGLPMPFDDTDAPPTRSGMTLHTDARTGCQYLGRLTGLTPRLDAQGRHMCGGSR